MSRVTLPFVADDISAVAKSLRGQLADRENPPSHVEMLNMLARATGHRNFQHFRARAAAGERLGRPVRADSAADLQRVERVARHFDEKGRLIRWPGRDSHRELCLWALWSSFPAGEILAEPQVNAFLADRHLFGDHALLRRALCAAGLTVRTPDGREYRRVERRPPAEAAALIRHLRACRG